MPAQGLVVRRWRVGFAAPGQGGGQPAEQILELPECCCLLRVMLMQLQGGVVQHLERVFQVHETQFQAFHALL